MQYLGHTYTIKLFLFEFYGGIRYFPGASRVVLVVKKLPASAGDIRDLGSIPASGGSLGEGRGNPPQYFIGQPSSHEVERRRPALPDVHSLFHYASHWNNP